MPLSNIIPANYDNLFAQKIDVLRERLAPFCDGSEHWTTVASSPEAYRLRAEFRMWHEGDALNYVMFRPGEPRDPIAITHFPVASQAIQALMPRLLAALQDNPALRRKLFQVEFLNTLKGDMLVTLIYHRPLETDWEIEAETLSTNLAVNIVGRSRRQKIVIGADHVEECLQVDGEQFYFRQYEQSFTQPNGEVNQAMIAWARRAAADIGGDLLELYCGNGNFTLPLAACFDRVLATEVAKSSIAAAKHNADVNQVNNVTLVRLSAEEVSQALEGVRQFRRLRDVSLEDFNFSTVFVDPPRAGLDEHSETMVTRYDNILYVSCNPETQCDNLKTICKTHKIVRIAAFDQFPYTDHLECGLLLARRD